MRIEELIGDLLLRHNCVVIPTFGGFVAGQTSATFDANKGVVLPPRKSLLFNKQLINNDGLLVAAYAKEAQLSYDDAFVSMQDQVSSWQRKLAKGERVTIERVGFLFLDAEKNIGFEQDRFNNLLLSSFGLGKVHFVTEEDIQWVVQENSGRASIPNETIETPIIPLVQEQEVETDSEELTPIIPIQRSKAWKYGAAAAVFLPICFYSYWIPVRTPVLESGMISIQDFNPFHSKEQSRYVMEEIDTKMDAIAYEQSIDEITATLPEDVSVFSYQMDYETFIPVKVKEENIAEPVVEIKEIPKPAKVVKEPKKAVVPSKEIANAIVESGSRHLIVGCFSTADNANRLVAQLKAKGYNAYVVDVVNGLHRVSAANASTDSALNQTNSRLSSLKISGWILRK